MEDSSLPNNSEHDINVKHSVFNILQNKKNVFRVFGLIVFLSIFYFLFFSPPADFPVGSVVKIDSGMSLRSISAILEKQHFIRSRTVFESFVVIFGAELHIQSADYLFENKLPVWEIARRIARGERNMAPVVVTVPEGFDVNQIGELFASKLTNFNKAQFLLEAKNKEGYLFPDTYFFLTNDDEKSVLQSMSDNFNKKIAPLLPEIAKSGKSEKNIIIMASIIEREAKGEADRDFISGILWRRINIGMALQVDAAPETYKTRGLPKSPIGNPGIAAIEASLRPQKSPYLYYLHDKMGNIHYAKTFAEHVQNKLKYLGN